MQAAFSFSAAPRSSTSTSRRQREENIVNSLLIYLAAVYSVRCRSLYVPGHGKMPVGRPLSIIPTTGWRPASSRLRLHRRQLHLAPPFLLDTYIPRYHLLSSVDAAKKRSHAYAHLRNCNLCPRLCGVNRYEKTGHCLIGAETVKVNVIAPHFGEEPCIQGWNGSGSVFFSGCNLRCVFCQNHVRFSCPSLWLMVRG